MARKPIVAQTDYLHVTRAESTLSHHIMVRDRLYKELGQIVVNMHQANEDPYLNTPEIAAKIKEIEQISQIVKTSMDVLNRRHSVF